MQVQFRGLRAFCVAARHLSFKDAAEELCLTASAVSHQIKSLEEQLGVTLFERRTRSVALTDDGRTLQQQVQPHLRAIERAVVEFRRRPQRCPLVIQMPEFFASELFMPRVAAFSQAHRHVDLRIETTAPGARLSGRADVSIVLSLRRPDGPLSQALFPIRYVPACSPDLHRLHAGEGLGALSQMTLLVHQSRPRAWHQWLQLAGVEAPPPRQIIRFDSMFALARAAEQGAGAALIPMPMSGAWFAHGRLRRMFELDLESADHYHAVLSGDSQHPDAALALWRWIVDTFTEHDKQSNIHERSSSIAG